MAGESNDPWAWVGLLKWSLNYVDGTSDTSSPPAMSEEDKKFLEEVMREGIQDEGERMNQILKECSDGLEYYKHLEVGGNGNNPSLDRGRASKIEDLLLELRDIVEQVDYARAFCSLQGLPFLIGCATQEEGVPVSIRVAALGVISTLCQNNPPVQDELLERGAIKRLSDLIFDERSSDALKTKGVQAIGAIVRGHELAENVFSQLDQAVPIFMLGLDESSSQGMKSRSLFFLKALVTSDWSDEERVQRLIEPITKVVDSCLKDSVPVHWREMTLSLMVEMRNRNLGKNILSERKDRLARLAGERISVLKEQDEDLEELVLLEQLLVKLEDI